MRVLLVEGDGDERAVAVRQLRREGFAVDVRADLSEAEAAVLEQDYDCVVSARELPDGDSLKLVEQWRADGNDVPVMFIDGDAPLEERLAGLAVADDYLAEPYQVSELVARVRVLCRRRTWLLPVIERYGDLEVNRSTREVWRAGMRCDLTPKEFAILEVLVERAGGVVSVSELVERCWDDRADLFTRAVYVHVASLRRKLGEPPLVRTVRGEGYALRRRA
ncbi:MAG TPA: response regulator transcription factor [Acidimicrobiales bacterium]